MLSTISRTAIKSLTHSHGSSRIGMRQILQCQYCSSSMISLHCDDVVPSSKRGIQFANQCTLWKGRKNYLSSSIINNNGIIQSKRWFQSEVQFHSVADESLESILDELECAFEDNLSSAADDFPELNYAAGVLTMRLPPHGTWVLNKQTPNRQIWWSSPISGPRRYEWDEEEEMWVNTKYADAMLKFNGFLNDKDRKTFEEDVTLSDIIKKEIKQIYSIQISNLDF